MGLFDKFKKAESKAEETNRVSIFDTDYPIDRGNWFQVLSACLGKVMTIQEACSEQVVKGQDWNVDFSAGTISFGNSEYPLQFIGSEANSSNSWMWGWNNINGFNDNILSLTNQMNDLGEKWNLEPLITDQFTLDDAFNGHNLSIVTCGISKENYCYYRGPHAGGAIFVAFSGIPDTVFAPVDAVKFISIVTKCIQQYHIDHKIFIESFLMWNGIKYTWKENDIIAHFSSDLCIAFEEVEEFMRISSMKTLRQPS